MKVKILALDLEGTLISNAASQFPRPGLRSFLEFCFRNFHPVAPFTAVSKERTRTIREWEPPYDPKDRELDRVRAEIATRLGRV